MITYPIKKTLPLLFLTLTGVALANDQTSTTNPQPQNVPMYCPALNALQKNPTTQTWEAKDGWKSYDVSFVDKVTEFSGAQWRGTNVGQIFCIYRGAVSVDFPIILAFRVLAFAPQGGKWSSNLGGYQNCETRSQADCPFYMRVQNQQEDLYEEALKLKRPIPSDTRPGF